MILDKIRDFLKIKKFLIVGGSWGATLATQYAINYPKKKFIWSLVEVSFSWNK